MQFENEPKVKAWTDKIQRHGCKINRIDPLQLIHKKNDELLFAVCRTDISTPEGGKLPSIIMIRGDVVVVVPMIKNSDTGEERFLMVMQHRIGSGNFELEFPAGMIDRNIDDPVGVAVEEVREETGLKIQRSDLFPLSNKLLYSSPGLHDEGVNYFGCIIELPDKEYATLEGTSAGLPDENEKTLVVLKTGNEAMEQTQGAQVILAMYLFEAYRKNSGKKTAPTSVK
jgi:8-oxo-dGTP pyrophosphatase MutT (NUDIX family)